MKEYLGDRIHTLSDEKLVKLQSLLGMSCFDYIKEQYALIIFGDNGRWDTIKKALGRVVVDTLGKVRDDIHITTILDDDGVGYGELKKGISDRLNSISKDRSKFTNQFPTLEERSDSFILNHPRGGGIIEVKLLTVPESLETQVAKKCIEVKCPNNSKISGKTPRSTLESLAVKYYGGDKEKLIRETSVLLKDEAWVTDVVDRVN